MAEEDLSPGYRDPPQLIMAIGMFPQIQRLTYKSRLRWVALLQDRFRLEDLHRGRRCNNIIQMGKGLATESSLNICSTRWTVHRIKVVSYLTNSNRLRVRIAINKLQAWEYLEPVLTSEAKLCQPRKLKVSKTPISKFKIVNKRCKDRKWFKLKRQVYTTRSFRKWAWVWRYKNSNRASQSLKA